MKANPENIIDLMFDNKRQYQIPVYQRNYDWKKDNCIELYNDILNCYINQNTHFLGTIVQVQLDDENGIKRYIIIDGQQRTTSIYLLLKAMYDSCYDEPTKDELESLIYNYSSAKKYDVSDKNKLKLKPIKTDNEQFALLMTNKIEEMDKTSNIYINYKYFIKLINDSKNEEISIKNILYGLKKLEIVMISLKEPEDDPQVIFERINSTGEDLTLADLIRNYLLMTDSNMESLFEEYWLPMESLIGKDSLSDYFVNYLVFKLPDVLSSKNAYQQFKKYADKHSHREIIIDLSLYSKFYKAFTSGSDDYSVEINNLLNGYRILKQSTIYPFLFPIFMDFNDNIIDEDTLISVLTLFLNYTIRRAITGVPTNSLRGLYKTLYKRIFTDIKQKDNYFESICNFMASINTKDAMPADTVFKDKLITNDLYKNKNVCKYLLSIVENGINTIKESVKIDSGITIEHIMPQNKDNADWQKEIGPEFPFIYDKYLHTIGNLTLTGYNSELSDNKFVDKVQKLKETSKFTKLNEDVINQEHWNEQSIKNRADRLSSIIVNEFSLPIIFKKQPIPKDNAIKYGVHDVGNLSYTTPTSFILIGEKRDVYTYTEMLINIAESLYDLDSKIFEDLAKIEFKFDGGKKPQITYDPSLLRKPKEIENSGIYLETNFSSDNIVNFIRILLDKYEISDDDFLFYAIKRNDEQSY